MPDGEVHGAITGAQTAPGAPPCSRSARRRSRGTAGSRCCAPPVMRTRSAPRTAGCSRRCCPPVVARGATVDRGDGRRRGLVRRADPRHAARVAVAVHRRRPDRAGSPDGRRHDARRRGERRRGLLRRAAARPGRARCRRPVAENGRLVLGDRRETYERETWITSSVPAEIANTDTNGRRRPTTCISSHMSSGTPAWMFPWARSSRGSAIRWPNITRRKSRPSLICGRVWMTGLPMRPRLVCEWETLSDDL